MSRLLQQLRVPLGFGFGAVLLYFARPAALSFALGTMIALTGLAIRLWAAGHLKKGEQLAVAGPYVCTRNPLYLGSFLLGLGFSMASGQPGVMAAFIFLFFLIYLPVMRREEEELLHRFGNRFRLYQQQVPFFLPRLGAVVGSDPTNTSSNFQWQRVILNREYRTILGFIVFAALVWIKALWQ